MELKLIKSSKCSEVDPLVKLHRETFPEYERFQDPSLMVNMIEHTQEMLFNAVYEDRKLAGFFIYWDLADFYYIHFITIYPEMRNRKIGQKILDWVSANLEKPVFLESEIPYNEITSRRLEFYKRNGFMELANDPAVLSEVRLGGHPLWLMGNKKIDNLNAYLLKIRDVVYYATGE